MNSNNTFTWKHIIAALVVWLLLVCVMALVSEFLLLPWSVTLMASQSTGAYIGGVILRGIHFIFVGFPFDFIAPAVGYIFTGEFFTPLWIKILLYPFVCFFMMVFTLVGIIVTITSPRQAM